MKRLILMSLTALALLVMTACGAADTEDNANGADEGNGSSEVVEENDEATEGTDGEEATEEEDAETDAEIIQDTGAYVGMADPHTIEVNSESNGTLSLQTGEVDYDFESIEENAHVAIKYFENEHGQNVLTSIEVK